MKNWRDWPIKTFSLPQKNGDKTIYYRGQLTENILKNCLAIVGARKMTRYGRGVVKKIIPPLVQAGITIVSGFMYGVDTQAHRTCLENGGGTIAVLASGLDNPYPPENNQLYSQILDRQGLVVSEYKKEFRATRWSFPARNKIVVNLSKAILVVEGGEKSGTLLTAKIAKKMNKPILAIPGPITSTMSIAPNLLIKEGATVITEAKDILTKLGIKLGKISLSSPNLSLIEKKILTIIKREPTTIDEISRQTEKSVVEISTILTNLSLRKIINESDGQYSA